MSWLSLLLALGLQDATDRQPEAEQRRLRLAPGFRIELVVSEPQAKKIVDIAFDDRGALWAVTASEYPLDGNEDSRAAELYQRGGQDQVLVIDRPWEGTRCQPRVFADGLAMPMTVLPLKEGVLIQHGSEILRLVDTDEDGRADHREVLLSGFGIEDSHLLPHRFLRAPDGWIYFAQGAFNSSLVLDRSGKSTRFDQCKVGRFKRDGTQFEVWGVGLNNIWGMVFDEVGDFWIQEANDLGYGIVGFVPGASYPGIGQHRFRPYAPLHPPGTHLRFGGTGLSGLAYSSSPQAFPAPYQGAFVLANPIERKVQAIRRQASTWESLPALIESDDPCFRPVAVHFGPDDSLYIVDWYNPIISHNEVPRTHPDRDRVRTRVWRLIHESQQPQVLPDLRQARAELVLEALKDPRQFVARSAWHHIVDRQLLELGPRLKELATDRRATLPSRALALWSLEGLGLGTAELVQALHDAPPALLRAALRAWGASGASASALLALAPDPGRHADREVRCEWLRVLAQTPADDGSILDRVLGYAPAPDETQFVIAEQDQAKTLTGQSLDAMSVRLWIRVCIEQHAEGLDRWLKHNEQPTEGRALAALSLANGEGARILASTLPQLQRSPTPEEFAFLARSSGDPVVVHFLASQLDSPTSTRAALEALLVVFPGDLSAQVRAQIASAARRVADPQLCVRVASALEIQELIPQLRTVALGMPIDPAQSSSASASPMLRRDAIRALVRLRHSDAELFSKLMDQSVPGDPLQAEALLALSSSPDPASLQAALSRMPEMSRADSMRALRQMVLSKAGAQALLAALVERKLDPSWMSTALWDSLELTSDHNPDIQRLRSEQGVAGSLVLVLSGGTQDAARSQLTLTPPFTIEAWVQCRETIDNRDGILASPGRFDLNFADGRPRLYLGPERGDVIIARTRLEVGRWTHVAITADAQGQLKLYLDGVLDHEVRVDPLGTYAGLDIGRTTPGHPELNLCEVRIWSAVRDARELALNYQRALDQDRPESLMLRFPGDSLVLDGAARVERMRDAPTLLDANAYLARQTRWERYTRLAEQGDADQGRAVFATLCQQCHSMNGVGHSVGPALDGIRNRGLPGILAAVLEPSAAVEAGYRVLRVERADETAVEGLLVSSDATSVTIRQASAAGALEPERIPREEIIKLRWSKLSVMPEGLLDTLSDQDAGSLLAFLLR